jgi:nucleotide-binding universal stress UspA family protein
MDLTLFSMLLKDTPMIENTSSRTPPKKILLATDLSANGDRALDRAAQLARQWGAQLLIVHAIDPKVVSLLESALPRAVDPPPSWRPAPDPTLTLRDRIKRDLREEVDDLKIHIEEGDPIEVILASVEREECDLIIVGVGPYEPFGRMLVGNMIENLVRKSPASVLVVKSRPNGPYGHVLVGTDFTEESRYGLEVAAGYFPDCRFTVMHGFEMPYKSFLADTSLSRDFAAMERNTIEEFVKEAALEDQVRARIRTMIEHGRPDLMLSRYVEEQHADLTVIGAYGRGFLFHLLIGGYTPRIVDSVPSDILLVRAHRAPSGGTNA